MRVAKAQVIFLLAGVLLGGLVGTAQYWFTLKHHYQELETFFRGETAGRQVVGISFFDYYGLGFFQYNQWKVVLRDPDGGDVIIYQNRPVFQEPKPYRPEIEIRGSEISIDDGINNLKVAVQPGGAVRKE